MKYRGGGPRGGESDADLWDVRQARRMARAAQKAGRPVSSVVAWTMAPEWLLVGTRGHSARGSVWKCGQLTAGNSAKGVIG